MESDIARRLRDAVNGCNLREYAAALRRYRLDARITIREARWLADILDAVDAALHSAPVEQEKR